MLLVSGIKFSIGKIKRISNDHHRVSSNESKELKIPRKYIACPVNSTGEVNSLLDYSPVNSALHNLPVNRIFMNIYF
jgi:hypothetical protein